MQLGRNIFSLFFVPLYSKYNLKKVFLNLFCSLYCIFAQQVFAEDVQIVRDIQMYMQLQRNRQRYRYRCICITRQRCKHHSKIKRQIKRDGNKYKQRYIWRHQHFELKIHGVYCTYLKMMCSKSASNYIVTIGNCSYISTMLYQLLNCVVK